MVPNNCNQIIWCGTQKTLVVKYLPNNLVRGTKFLVTITKVFLVCRSLALHHQVVWEVSACEGLVPHQLTVSAAEPLPG